MAHFAKINNDNIVLQVLTLDNKDMLNNDNVENETIGQQYLEKHNNWPAQMWIQTSYNTYNNQHKNGGTPFRGNYAGIGYTWDQDNQIFWPPKPFPSWVKLISEARWQSPIGDAPALTQEQQDQNTANTHWYEYRWDEDAYQADNTTGWSLTNKLA
jgi:hypothetical protein